MIIKPQQGYQEKFLSTQADIAIGGGSAGAGKTFSLLLEALRYTSIDDYRACIFRRTTPEITNAGGLWDEASKLYIPLDAEPIRSPSLSMNFNNRKSKISFHHLQREDDVYSWQGSQVSLLCFDEVTHFTEKQFWYMLSRNRSTIGIKPYVRATCNPDPDSFIRKLIDWYIGPDGIVLPERSGKLRWFIRLGDDLIFADTPTELVDKYGSEAIPKSLTFIGGTINDNQILMEKNPEYLANLRALSKVDRERLEKGNWNIRPKKSVVAHAFDDQIHVHEFERKGMPIYIGQDFNVSPMAGIVAEIYDNQIWIFDEIYLGKDSRSNTYELGDHILKNWGTCQIVCDSTGTNMKTSATMSDHTILKSKGHKILPFLNPLRQDRFNCMNGLLEHMRIHIHPKCKNLIAGLNNFEDNKQTEVYGHILDGFGYLCWYAFPLRTGNARSIQSQKR